MGLFGILPQRPPGPDGGKDGAVSARAWGAGAPLQEGPATFSPTGPHGPRRVV